MKSLISVLMILLCSWTAFGRGLTPREMPAMAASKELATDPAAENHDTPAAIPRLHGKPSRKQKRDTKACGLPSSW